MEFADVLDALKDQMEDRHIMLSYQWDLQELVAKVYDVMQGFDINVWMDIEGGVSGNINEAMASGVEGAAVICCFMTQKYGKSKNCAAELNYANDRATTIVPCMAQSRTDEGHCYRASGWLGIITAGKLWIDFKSDEQLESRVVQLLNECCARLSQSETPVGKMQFIKKKIQKTKKQTPKKKKTRQAAAKYSEGLVTLPNESSITIPLKQPLETGDEIEVWGEYEFGEKFNFNVIGDNLSETLLHFDIRPTQNTTVLNHKKNGRWMTEIRDPYIVRKFERGEYSPNFHFVMKCEADKLTFKINGEKISKDFPIMVPLSQGKNVVLRDEAGLGRWKMLKLPPVKENKVSNKDSFNITPNEEIILEEALSFGDSIGVWGKYSSEGRFSFNIMRPKGDYLLHMDVRPEAGSIALDSCLDSNWPGSLNLHLNEAFEHLKFSENGDFHIKIEFLEDGMSIFVNGKSIGTSIAYEFDLTKATYIMCTSVPELEDSPWKRIKLPNSHQIFQSFGSYEFEKLAIGDVINVTGKYQASVAAFALNIMADAQTITLHISIRPLAGEIVLNTLLNGAWGQEIRSAIPDSLAACELFDIFIMVGEREYDIELSRDEDNENVLVAMKMPHRADFRKGRYMTFSDVDDNVWTELNMPDGTTYSREI